MLFDASKSFASDDDFGSSDSMDCDQLQGNLANWAGEHQISHAALNDLLKLVLARHNSLTRESKTLLDTVRSVDVLEKAVGHYQYFGVLNTITGILYANKAQLEQNMCVNLQANIDGLPLFRSSTIKL